MESESVIDPSQSDNGVEPDNHSPTLNETEGEGEGEGEAHHPQDSALSLATEETQTIDVDMQTELKLCVTTADAELDTSEENLNVSMELFSPSPSLSSSYFQNMASNVIRPDELPHSDLILIRSPHPQDDQQALANVNNHVTVKEDHPSALKFEVNCGNESYAGGDQLETFLPSQDGLFDLDDMIEEICGDAKLTTNINSDRVGTVGHNSSPGGVIKTEECMETEEERETAAGGCKRFINKDARVSPSPMLQYTLDTDQPFDTVISCADGRVGAHRLVLAAASPFIGSLFSGFDHRLGEVGRLILPDIRVAVMNKILSFMYTGKMTVHRQNMKEICDTMKMLLIGEFGEIKIAEVEFKQPPPPMSSRSNIFAEQERPSGVARLERCIENTPEAEASISVNELLSTTATSDEEDDSEESGESESENDENEAPISEDNADSRGRPAISAFFGKRARGGTEPPYNYIIAPAPPGAKVKKLQCSRCPAAFKSTETLNQHLEDNHSLSCESRHLDQGELKKLLKCDFCSAKHGNIASCNHCLRKHKRTRCYVCFESVSLKKFEQHTAAHGENINGMCVVACTWCDAGIVFQSPFDNKAMSGHCFSQHFSHTSSNKVSKSSHTGVATSAKSLPNKTNNSNSTPFNSNKMGPSSTTSGNPSVAFAGQSTSNHLKEKTMHVVGSSSKSSKPIPNVLAMLQKASLTQKKRKIEEELDYESEGENSESVGLNTSHNKRVRLTTSHVNEEGEKVHMSRRTGGKPVGRKIDLKNLKIGAPDFKSKSVSSGKGTGDKLSSVWLDVEKLPQIYVKFGYSKTFISSSKHEAEKNNTDENPNSEEEENSVRKDKDEVDNAKKTENLASINPALSSKLIPVTNEDEATGTRSQNGIIMISEEIRNIAEDVLNDGREKDEIDTIKPVVFSSSPPYEDNEEENDNGEGDDTGGCGERAIDSCEESDSDSDTDNCDSEKEDSNNTGRQGFLRTANSRDRDLVEGEGE